MPDRVISVPQATQIATRIKNKFDNVNGRLREQRNSLFTYVNLKYTGYKLNCNLGTNTIVPSPANTTLFVEVKPNTIYKIKVASSRFFRTAFFTEKPVYNSTVINNSRVSHDGATEAVRLTTEATNYIGIWYYNSGDEHDEEYYYNSINVYEYDMEQPHSPELTAIKLNKDNIITGVNAVSIPEFYNSYREDKLNYRSFYCKIKNPSNILYTDQPIQIKLHLDDFVCKGQDYIRIFNNNAEVPFQFEEVYLNLPTEHYNNTYYNSGCVKNCILWTYGTLDVDEEIEYEIRIYESRQEYNFTPKVTLDYLTNIQQVRVSDGENVYTFASALSSGSKRLFNVNGDSKFGAYDRIKLPDTTEVYVRESADNNVDFVSERILGNGVVYYDVEIIHETEYFRWTNIYRVFKGQIQTSAIQIVKQEYTRDNISSLVHSLYLGNGSSIIASETQNYKAAQVLSDNRHIQVSIVYNNGNIPRSDSNNRIPNMNPFSGFSFSSSQNAVQVYAGCGTTSLQQTFPVGFYYSQCVKITFDSDSNTYLQHFNPLCGFATDTNEITLNGNIKPSILDFMHVITDWGQKAGYGTAVNGMGQYIKYWRYKLGITPWNTLKTLVQTNIIDKYNLSDAASFRAAMEIPWGIEYQGRVMPLIYLMYKEAVKLNDQTAAVQYKNLVVENGIFFCDLFEEFNHDIPLNTNPASVRNNSRTSALHCLACAITLDPTNERFNATYQELAQVIIANSDLNTMLKEGNLSDSRYSHYMNFAMYQWVVSDKMVPINNKNNFTNYDNFILDIFEPGGEIKDSFYCPSTARRAEPHTYAYCLATLYLVGGYGDIALCEQIINHMHKNIKPNGVPAFPMDRYPGEYTTDSLHTYVFALGAFVFLNEYL